MRLRRKAALKKKDLWEADGKSLAVLPRDARRAACAGAEWMS